MRAIKYIVLHCTGGPQNQSVQAILDFWKSKLGWKNPGYHFLIKPDGEIVELLPIEKISNGVKGYNANAIHISYIGGQNGIDNRTAAQKWAQEKLVRKYRAMFPNAKVLGHRDLSPDLDGDGIIEPKEWTKLCPSFDVAKWLISIGICCLILFAMVSCKSKATLTESTMVRDSTVTTVTVVPRDTLVKVPGDSLRLTTTIAELRKALYITETRNRVTAGVGLKGDTLTVDCKIDSLLLELELRDTTINTLRARLEKKATIEYVDVKYVPWYVQILATIGGFVFFSWLLKIALNYFKIKIPFL